MLPVALGFGDDDEGLGMGKEWEQDDAFMREFARYKENYYKDKLEYRQVTRYVGAGHSVSLLQEIRVLFKVCVCHIH